MATVKKYEMQGLVMILLNKKRRRRHGAGKKALHGERRMTETKNNKAEFILINDFFFVSLSSQRFMNFKSEGKNDAQILMWRWVKNVFTMTRFMGSFRTYYRKTLHSHPASRIRASDGKVVKFRSPLMQANILQVKVCLDLIKDAIVNNVTCCALPVVPSSKMLTLATLMKMKLRRACRMTPHEWLRKSC